MKSFLLRAIGSALLIVSAATSAAPVQVLWWDTTPEYGGQAPNARRQAMSDYLTNFGGVATTFQSTYVNAEGAGGSLATRLAGNSYDVIVFDSTPSSSGTINAADQAAIGAFYTDNNKNVMLDGTLYIRNINFNAQTNFPGTNGALGGLLANQVLQIAQRGGGFLIGTDHNCCQAEANRILGSAINGAAFSGFTYPTNVGTFFGSDLLNGGAAAISALDVFNHWDAVDSQAVTPTGNFTDRDGAAVTLYSQVDVVDAGGGGLTSGVAYSYISTSWAPGSGSTGVTDPNPGGSGGTNNVPEPGTLLLTGLALLALVRTRRAA